VHDRGWLVRGHRSTEWCPRCGTSLSQHELSQAGVFQDREDPALMVRLPLLEHPGEALLIWTTTPWTLPANVAAAVSPGITYGRLPSGGWVSVESQPEDVEFTAIRKGREFVGLRYEGPFDGVAPAVEHRVIPWEDVSLDTGTGIVHIAPGAGPEDFVLSTVHDLPVLTPVDEAGRFEPEYGWLAGMSIDEARQPIIDDLEKRGLLAEAGTIVHAYPHCWRCDTPLIFRVADDWLIAVDGVRQQLLDENAKVQWTPAQYGKRMDDWLRNMDDWNISRRRYFGLPLPFYPCESCGTLTVIGSLAELRERATGGLEQLQELHRPWIDEVPIRCDCGAEVRRVTEVGDAWLDAGIVPFSTLGWQNPEWQEHGYATGAAAGLTGADLPDHSYWETWYPADWVSEMREQIRLWFYSQCFMSVTLTGQSPYKAVLTYEKLLDENGREMHRSWGNAIDAAEALGNIGADVIRFMFCEHVPSQNLKFGYGPAAEIRRRLLTYWNSVKFFVDYANVDGFSPGPEPPGELQPLDRWLVERTEQLVADITEQYERYWTPGIMRAFDEFVDDLSNWYIRRSRRRFWNSDEVALWTLWHALIRSVQVIGPVMPFLTDFLWRRLRTDAAPNSVFLEPWPEPRPRDEELLREVAEVRRVVELGRQARGDAGVKLRQPLRRLVVQGAALAQRHVDEIAEELRVKEVEFAPVEAMEVRVKPNLPVLGPKLGKELASVRKALEAGEFEQLEGGGVRVNGHELGADEVLVERRAREGWALAADDGVTVAMTTELDDELRREGRVYELIHRVNTMRKDAGLELTDRIRLTLPAADADLLEHADWIKEEVLATDIATDSVSEPAIAKA
jgi:isoleucyl-tRNA synthetase